MEKRPELSGGTAPPPVASVGTAAPRLTPPRAGTSVQSEARLCSNPDVSNRNVKKTKLPLSRSLAVCYLSLGVRVISVRYAAALGEPRIFWGLAVK